jgi:hypothetical protein
MPKVIIGLVGQVAKVAAGLVLLFSLMSHKVMN